jgi:predicted Fe-Mo cluster-binding NifX family protein
MRIAFSATGDGWAERMDERFGRARGFFVLDTGTDARSYIDNAANAETAHGAGTSAARSVADAGVEVVVTGHVGPKAGQVLRAAGIRVLCAGTARTIEDAYRDYQSGRLSEQDL